MAMAGHHRVTSRNGGRQVIVEGSLQQRVNYFSHNLATDGSLGEFQAILGQRVLTHLTATANSKALSLFRDSLCRLGLLLLECPDSLADWSVSRAFKRAEPALALFKRANNENLSQRSEAR